MTCWVVIPVKAPGACKTRLAGVLGDAARRDLVATMLAHVAGVAGKAAGVDEVLLLGPSHHGLSVTMRRLDDPGRGLNAALASAVRAAAGEGVDRLVFVSADLPLLAPVDIEALIDRPAGVAAIAPDRVGIGTNALSLPGSCASGFALRYGAGSFAAHVAEAVRLALDLVVVRSPGLALDIDLPADLAMLRSSAYRHSTSSCSCVGRSPGLSNAVAPHLGSCLRRSTRECAVSDHMLLNADTP